MIFSYQFSTMADVYKHFCTKSKYLIRTVNLIFGNQSAICNGTITKIDFFNIVAGATEHLKYVKKFKALLLTSSYTKGTIAHFFNGIVNKKIIYNDEIYFALAAIYTQLCVIKPKHKDVWKRLIAIYRTPNQRHNLDKFIKIAGISYNMYK